MIPTLQLGQAGLHRPVSAAGGGAAYDALVAAMAPLLWWKLNETSGTSAADASGNGWMGAMSPGSFADPGVSVAAPAGYLGLGRGVDMTPGERVMVNDPGFALSYGTSALSQWAVGVWLKGVAGAQYVISRGSNHGTVLVGYSAGNVEYFDTGYTGSDPRPGSQLACGNSVPEFYVYRYDAGQWAGFRNGAKVFDVARSFTLGNGGGYFEVHQLCASQVFDTWIVDGSGIPSDADVAAMYAARNG